VNIVQTRHKVFAIGEASASSPSNNFRDEYLAYGSAHLVMQPSL